MEGCATPDNHALMVHQITETYLMYGGNSYDLADHKEILAAYDKFLDKWKLPQRLPHRRTSLQRPRQKVLRHLAELPRERAHLRRTRLRRHLRLGVHRDREPLRHRRQPAQLQIRPHTHQRHTHTHPPRSETTQRLHRTRRIRHLRSLPPQRHAATRHRHLSLHRYHALEQAPQASRIPCPATRRRPVQLPHQRILPNPTPHRRRPLPLQIRSLLRTSLHPDQRDLGHRATRVQARPCTQYRSVRNHFRVSTNNSLISRHASASKSQTSHTGKKYDVIITSGLTAHTSATQNSGDTTGLENQPGHEVGAVPTTTEVGHIDPAILEAVRAGTPLLAIPQADTLSDGVAKQLAAAGAFTYNGTVGDYRAPWMGNWYFVREHPIYAGLPVNQVMGIHYQTKGRQANGLLVDGPNVRNHRRLLPRPRPQHRRRHLHHQTGHGQDPLPPRPRPPPGPPATLPRQRTCVADQLKRRRLKQKRQPRRLPPGKKTSF